MNWVTTLSSIRTKLAESDFKQEAEELSAIQASAGTAGEMLDGIVFKLAEMKKENLKAFSVIAAEAELIFAYARSIGYL
jgi:hypothetical protein